MNAIERIKMVKAMEYIARCINNEDIFYGWWASMGVADGDIPAGELELKPDDVDIAYYYEEDKDFSDLMDTFLRCMKMAAKDGGLFCDGVVSNE